MHASLHPRSCTQDVGKVVLSPTVSWQHAKDLEGIEAL